MCPSIIVWNLIQNKHTNPAFSSSIDYDILENEIQVKNRFRKLHASK